MHSCLIGVYLLGHIKNSVGSNPDCVFGIFTGRRCGFVFQSSLTNVPVLLFTNFDLGLALDVFLSNQIVHMIWFSHCIWASDLLFNRSSKTKKIKGSDSGAQKQRLNEIL